MKRVLLTGMSVIAFASGSAFAADLPARMPTKAPVYAPVYNWTGFYLGGNLGWGWSSGDATTVLNGVGGTGSGSGDAFIGGAQAGYNVQSGSIVFGIETDIQFTSGDASYSGTNGPFTTTGTTNVPWFGTIRGRLGYAPGSWMVYATGGAAYGATRATGTIAPTGVSFDDTETFWTWTVGGGFETALWDRWTAKVEYLYLGEPNDIPTAPGTSSVSGNAHTHIVRLGVNYRF